MERSAMKPPTHVNGEETTAPQPLTLRTIVRLMRHYHFTYEDVRAMTLEQREEAVTLMLHYQAREQEIIYRYSMFRWLPLLWAWFVRRDVDVRAERRAEHRPECPSGS